MAAEVPTKTDEPDSASLDFAKRITHWRTEAKLSKSELAAIMDVEPSMVSKWERATLRPGLGYHHKFCEAVGVSMQIFWARLPSEAE